MILIILKNIINLINLVKINLDENSNNLLTFVFNFFIYYYIGFETKVTLFHINLF